MSATENGALSEQAAAAKIKSLLFGEPAPVEAPAPTPDPIQEDEVEQPAASASPAEEDEGVDVSTLANWLGVEPDSLILDDSGVKLRTKVDGQTGEANLAQLLKAYQLESTANKRLEEIAQKRKAFEAETEARQKAYTEKLTLADGVISTVEAKLLKDFERVNWDELRAENETAYWNKRQEFRERQEEVQGMRSTLNQQIADFQNQQLKAMKERYNDMRSKELNALLDKLPDWRDQEKAKNDQLAVRNMLKEFGYQDGEIDGQTDQSGNILHPGIIDHRFILLARDALAYRKLQQKAPEVEQKVKKVPKLIKPGPTQNAVDVATEQHKKDMANLKKSGNLKDAQKIIKRLLAKG